MESDRNPFPEINLGLTDRIKDVAGRLGRFIFRTPEVKPFMSNHYDKSHFEPTDGKAYQPSLFEEL